MPPFFTVFFRRASQYHDVNVQSYIYVENWIRRSKLFSATVDNIFDTRRDKKISRNEVKVFASLTVVSQTGDEKQVMLLSFSAAVPLLHGNNNFGRFHVDANVIRISRTDQDIFKINFKEGCLVVKYLAQEIIFLIKMSFSERRNWKS